MRFLWLWKADFTVFCVWVKLTANKSIVNNSITAYNRLNDDILVGVEVRDPTLYLLGFVPQPQPTATKDNLP